MTSTAAPNTTDTEVPVAMPAPAVASSGASLSPDMRVPTLQPPAASLAPAVATVIAQAAPQDSEESASAPAPVDTAETSGVGTSAVTKSVTESMDSVMAATASVVGSTADSQAATAADSTPSAATAAAAAQAAPLHTASAQAQPTTDARAPQEIRAPVGSAAWTEELGTQLTLMTRHGQDSASLHLSPEHLGPLEVRIDMRDGAASVWFGAAHADTRSALEQSLPRLRELFANSGLLLADAGVARDAPRQNTRPSTPAALPSSAAEAAIASSKASAAPAHLGLVDTYA